MLSDRQIVKADDGDVIGNVLSSGLQNGYAERSEVIRRAENGVHFIDAAQVGKKGLHIVFQASDSPDEFVRGLHAVHFQGIMISLHAILYAADMLQLFRNQQQDVLFSYPNEMADRCLSHSAVVDIDTG